MLYFLFLSQVCNLKCSYCGGTPLDNLMPRKISYDLETLKDFLKKDPDPRIIFYGGEPLLFLSEIKKIMDEIPATYLLQTNGLLLKRLPATYLNKFAGILVSIDGRPAVTNFYRGANVFENIIKNVNYIRKEQGYRGDLIARLTVSEKSRIEKDVPYLINLGIFDHYHWQLDALWDYPADLRWKNFDQWLYNIYNPGIEKLVKYWVDETKNQQKLLGIVPFIGIMKTLLTQEPAKLKCGAGEYAFSITTDGTILPCPVATGYEWATIGVLGSTTPEKLPGVVTLEEPCVSCDIRHICGGRCLVANKTKYWGEHGFKMVCDSIRHLIAALEKVKPQIEQLIEDSLIDLADFFYPATEMGLEVIP